MPLGRKSLLMRMLVGAENLPPAVCEWAAERWSGAAPLKRNHGAAYLPKRLGRSLLRTCCPADADWREVVSRVAAEPAAVASWEELQALVKAVRQEVFVTSWALSLDVCMRTWDTGAASCAGGSHVWLRNGAPMEFRGVVPHRAPGRGAAAAAALRAAGAWAATSRAAPWLAGGAVGAVAGWPLGGQAVLGTRSPSFESRSPAEAAFQAARRLLLALG